MAVNLKTKGARLTGFALIATLICMAPLLGVTGLALFGPWSDYLSHIASTRLPDYLVVTFQVTVISGSTALCLGIPQAWLITRYQFPAYRIFEWAAALPLAVPAYAAAYAWYDLTQAAGLLGPYLPTLRGPAGAGLVLGFTLYPYVYLLCREAFASQSIDAYEAARTLGSKSLSAFWRVAIPMARPAIAVSLALVVMESLADYGTVAHLGAPTLSVGLFRAWAGEGATAEAARLALILVLIAFTLFWIERQQRQRTRQSQASGRYKSPYRIRLNPGLGFLALILCMIPVTLGLIIPMAHLLNLAQHAPVADGLAQSTQNSLILALVSALIAMGLGLGLAYALKRGTHLARFTARLAGLGYAVPGAVIALGVLIVLGQVQTKLDQIWQMAFGGIFPVLLSGSVFALVLAYQSRFAAAAISPIESAFSRLSPHLDEASRTLGLNETKTAWHVHLPLARHAILLAGLIVFVEVLKELPTTMILRPFNFETLAVTAHNYAADERLGEAALPALLIIILALPVMIWISHRLTDQGTNR